MANGDLVHVGRPLGEASNWFVRSLAEHAIELEEQYSFSRFLDTYQRHRNMRLSPGAVLLLVIPLIEYIQIHEQAEIPTIGPEQFETSMFAILDGALEEATLYDKALNAARPYAEGKTNLRTGWSIIRQWWRKFCNCPPFCGPTEDDKS